jgi:hypothetical protein
MDEKTRKQKARLEAMRLKLKLDARYRSITRKLEAAEKRFATLLEKRNTIAQEYYAIFKVLQETNHGDE